MCDSSDIDEVTLKESLQKYQDSAYRTLGFAIDKHFVGVVAIEDPVREDVPDAVKECMNAGIMVKIVTGDTPGTAKQIGREIGLWADADTDRNIITGTELAELSDEKLQECVLDLKIIARARPMDKKRLVEALQARNQVVAVTGDGTMMLQHCIRQMLVCRWVQELLLQKKHLILQSSITHSLALARL